MHLPQCVAHRLLCESPALRHLAAVVTVHTTRQTQAMWACVCFAAPWQRLHDRRHAILPQGWLLDGSAGGSNISLYGDAVGG